MWQFISKDIGTLIFSHLENEDLNNVGKVCNQWNWITKSDLLRRERYKNTTLDVSIEQREANFRKILNLKKFFDKPTVKAFVNDAIYTKSIWKELVLKQEEVTKLDMFLLMHPDLYSSPYGDINNKQQLISLIEKLLQSSCFKTTKTMSKLCKYAMAELETIKNIYPLAYERIKFEINTYLDNIESIKIYRELFDLTIGFLKCNKPEMTHIEYSYAEKFDLKQRLGILYNRKPVDSLIVLASHGMSPEVYNANYHNFDDVQLIKEIEFPLELIATRVRKKVEIMRDFKRRAKENGVLDRFKDFFPREKEDEETFDKLQKMMKSKELNIWSLLADVRVEVSDMATSLRNFLRTGIENGELKKGIENIEDILNRRKMITSVLARAVNHPSRENKENVLAGSKRGTCETIQKSQESPVKKAKPN